MARGSAAARPRSTASETPVPGAARASRQPPRAATRRGRPAGTRRSGPPRSTCARAGCHRRPSCGHPSIRAAGAGLPAGEGSRGRVADRGGGHELDFGVPRAALYPGGATRVHPPEGRYVHAVQEYYDDLWERLLEDLTPPDLALRRRFALANVTRGDRVLDLGCGTGDLAADIGGAGTHVTAADVARAALDRAARRHPDLALRLISIAGPLPFGDGAFDIVFASEVIEHVADTAR